MKVDLRRSRNIISNRLLFFRALSITALLLLTMPINSVAWWGTSLREDTVHFKLTRDAESQIRAISPDVLFPDITKNNFFENNDICAWTSGTTDDTRAHDGHSNKNDGPIERWWLRLLQRYKSFIISGDNELLVGDESWGAFYFAALMTHLTEDMAVPAHVYNIPHGQFGIFDNMEELAHNNYENLLPTITITDPGKNTFANYNNLTALTFSMTQLTSQVDWREYYNRGDIECEPLFFDKERGHYGRLRCDNPWPLSSDDSFPNDWDHANDNQKEAVSTFLGKSGSYAAGTLMAVSRSLPPLVREYYLGDRVGSERYDPILVDSRHGTNIVFKIMENRLQGVEIKFVATHDGTKKEYYIVADDGENAVQIWNYAPRLLVENNPFNLLHPYWGDTLPWQRAFTLLAWTGIGVPVDPLNGTSTVSLPNGLYTLKIFVKDTDGNELNQVYEDQVRDNPDAHMDINNDGIVENDTVRMFEIRIPLPPAVSDLQSYSHSNAIVHWDDPQSRNKSVMVSWTLPIISQGYAIDGYSYVWDNNLHTVPPTTKMVDAATRSLTSDQSDGTSNFFHIRTVDAAGNWSQDVAEIGPFYIDTAGPRILATFP